ncbi:MAG: 1-deoxy-D-xylulose-5-phosphate reductoisomerase [Defluviitaleaceae bacterium]|nr:1-deoxy-D-xylulose-5-phosphate reductoisomerase [Defluviitaleaceae bacterium]
MKNIVILGSTGSIGTQALEVVDSLGAEAGISALTANSSADLLYDQIVKYKPKLAVVMNAGAYDELRNKLRAAGIGVKLAHGMDGLLEAASMDCADVCVNALVGSVGLLPTLAAIDAGTDVALANKETIVTAGEIVMGRARARGVNIVPIDSEHSAIFQCLAGNSGNRIHRILLTASGGPFRGMSPEQLKSVTIEDALAHPNWVMGRKITIDSATLMNKGLEVIEARWLFDVDPSQIEVVVHPQSVIHSMVEFEDGAIMAQLGESDMRVSIAYALTYPRRARSDFKRLDIFSRSPLTFEPPDTTAFPCLAYAYDALRAGGTAPAVLNSANEAAVELFLSGKISFTDIPRLINEAVSSYNVRRDAKNLYSIPGMLDWRDDFSPIEEVMTPRTSRVRKEELTMSGGKSTAKTAFRVLNAGSHIDEILRADAWGRNFVHEKG